MTFDITLTQSWGLYLVDFGKDPNSISTEEVAAAVRSKERSMELLMPNSHPYILLQRPNNHHGLYFQRISSKRPKALDTIRNEEEVLWIGGDSAFFLPLCFADMRSGCSFLCV